MLRIIQPACPCSPFGAQPVGLTDSFAQLRCSEGEAAHKKLRLLCRFHNPKQKTTMSQHV